MHRVLKTVLAIATLAFATNSLVYAQATRTWVSGVGDDANPCSRTAPCKTFAGAISKTSGGGEISVLDPGGFGTVVITKSITISGDGTLASVLASGTDGININGPNIDVILRNLSLISTSSSAGTGVILNNGRSLLMDRVTISGFAHGILTVTGDATVINSTISNIPNYAALAYGYGSSITLENSTLVRNGVAVDASAGATVRLSNNSIYNNLFVSGCIGGKMASAGNNRSGNNTGNGFTCLPNAVITFQ